MHETTHHHGGEHPHLHVTGHTRPAWNDRADTAIVVQIPDVDDALEQLVVRRITDEDFEVCCIPFTLYDVALGDTIRVADLSPNTPGRIVERLSWGGHFAFRVAITRPDRVDLGSAASAFLSMGNLVEEYGTMLLAIDARDESTAEFLNTYLAQRQEAGDWEYESGH